MSAIYHAGVYFPRMPTPFFSIQIIPKRYEESTVIALPIEMAAKYYRKYPKLEPVNLSAIRPEYRMFALVDQESTYRMYEFQVPLPGYAFIQLKPGEVPIQKMLAKQDIIYKSRYEYVAKNKSLHRESMPSSFKREFRDRTGKKC